MTKKRSTLTDQVERILKSSVPPEPTSEARIALKEAQLILLKVKDVRVKRMPRNS